MNDNPDLQRLPGAELAMFQSPHIMFGNVEGYTLFRRDMSAFFAMYFRIFHDAGWI